MLIILTCVAGLTTIAISVVSIIDGNQKEKELKKTQAELSSKQDYLIELQKEYSSELKEKTDEIIKLQSLLRNNSESQLKELDRIKNPIPQELQITFTSKIVMSSLEISQIQEIINLKSDSHGGNLLPFDSNKTNDGFEKINRFKNIGFNLTISFQKNGKNMEVKYYRVPIEIYGFNTRNTLNSFLLAFLDDKSSISFNGFGLYTTDIRTNNKSPSLLDFNNSKISIHYSFTFPQLWQAGSLATHLYVTEMDKQFELDIETISITHKNYEIKVNNLKKISLGMYEGDWIVEK